MSAIPNGQAAEGERETQKHYWAEHSTGSIEAMMLDSNAAEIDKLERPEVRATLPNRRI